MSRLCVFSLPAFQRELTSKNVSRSVGIERALWPRAKANAWHDCELMFVVVVSVQRARAISGLMLSSYYIEAGRVKSRMYHLL